MIQTLIENPLFTGMATVTLVSLMWSVVAVVYIRSGLSHDKAMLENGYNPEKWKGGFLKGGSRGENSEKVEELEQTVNELEQTLAQARSQSQR